MRLAPIRTPLRLRIAIGLVAAERSPYAYAPSRKPITDHTWIIVLAWGFGIAMVLHLVLIVMLAFVAGQCFFPGCVRPTGAQSQHPCRPQTEHGTPTLPV